VEEEDVVEEEEDVVEEEEEEVVEEEEDASRVTSKAAPCYSVRFR